MYNMAIQQQGVGQQAISLASQLDAAGQSINQNTFMYFLSRADQKP